MSKFLRNAVIGAFMLACLVSACSPPSGRRPPPAKPSEPTAEDASAFLAKGNYAAALDILSARYEKNRGNTEARDAFSRTLQIVRGKGDDAFAGSDYEKAGIIYRLLLRHLMRNDTITKTLPFTSSYLSGGIEKCAKALTDSGLASYGSGDLENAIRIWQSVLTFDPNNTDVKKAIETATIQLRTLKGTP